MEGDEGCNVIIQVGYFSSVSICLGFGARDGKWRNSTPKSLLNLIKASFFPFKSRRSHELYYTTWEFRIFCSECTLHTRFSKFCTKIVTNSFPVDFKHCECHDVNFTSHKDAQIVSLYEF